MHIFVEYHNISNALFLLSYSSAQVVFMFARYLCNLFYHRRSLDFCNAIAIALSNLVEYVASSTKYINKQDSTQKRKHICELYCITIHSHISAIHKNLSNKLFINYSALWHFRQQRPCMKYVSQNCDISFDYFQASVFRDDWLMARNGSIDLLNRCDGLA